jgi:hypothetical protein
MAHWFAPPLPPIFFPSKVGTRPKTQNPPSHEGRTGLGLVGRESGSADTGDDGVAPRPGSFGSHSADADADEAAEGEVVVITGTGQGLGPRERRKVSG